MTELKRSSDYNPFFSLRNSNYRIYWFSTCLSGIAMWTQNATQLWLAYRMTDSAALLGFVSAMQFIPILLFSIFAGALIERLRKKTAIIVSQICLSCVALIMAALILSGNVRYGHVLMAAGLTGMINVFNFPLKQAIIGELVDKEDLVNAVALYSAVYNLARIIGPAVAGITIA